MDKRGRDAGRREQTVTRMDEWRGEGDKVKGVDVRGTFL